MFIVNNGKFLHQLTPIQQGMFLEILCFSNNSVGSYNVLDHVQSRMRSKQFGQRELLATRTHGPKCGCHERRLCNQPLLLHFLYIHPTCLRVSSFVLYLSHVHFYNVGFAKALYYHSQSWQLQNVNLWGLSELPHTTEHQELGEIINILHGFQTHQSR